jgi:hypothetical protein
MTWFDKSAQRRVKTAVFPDRSPEKKPVPAWIAEPAQHPSSLSTWLSSRPPAPLPAQVQAAVVAPAPPPLVRPSQPPPAARPAPPQPPPSRAPSSPPAFAPAGSTDALEAKTLSLQQRESMMPRASLMPPPLRPLPADILASHTPDTVDLSALQATYEAKLQAAMAVFEQAVEEVTNLRARILGEAEQTIVTLAAALARRVIGREITLDPEIMMTLAVEGTEALGERDRVLVRLAPFDREETWVAFVERLKRRVPRCEIIQDPALSPGQCVVESELGRVDESVDNRLATVLKAILPESTSTEN